MEDRNETNAILNVIDEKVFTPSADVVENFNPVEETELTEEEKEELSRLQKISDLKNMYKFKSTKDFGTKYKKDRKRKNKQASKSRKINRRK
jgi:hypothetical protein